ncbi:MAG: hypothetical protein ACYDAG_03605 [Chloroflexota bacterium]
MRQPIDLGQPVPYLSPHQVADYVRHDTHWVWRQIRSGQLKASRWSGSGELRVKWADFLAFLKAGEERYDPFQPVRRADARQVSAKEVE